ncbi:proton myo-inositol cotransporter hmit-1.3-like [Panulirus ornatus]|uniref:proton myo-inositol cotransporter hmit-1.3-like n=1 Tax=Panulirus ornatus TaxID=150431 RepID=UPI003A858D85
MSICLHSAGMASMPWTISSETFPGWARSEASSINLAANLSSSMITSLTFLSLSEAIFTHGVFYLFMTFTLVFTVVFFFIMPETKGISLENMETLFSKPLGTGVIDKAPRVHPDAGRS